MQTTEARELIERLVGKARKEGRDLWEVMEGEGYILTPLRRRQVALEAVTLMLRILGSTEAEEVLQRYRGGKPSTPQEMFEAIMEWLGDYLAALEAGHVG